MQDTQLLMYEDEQRKAESGRGRSSTRLRYWWPVLGLAVVLLMYSGFAGVVWWIQADAYRFAARARQEFAGDEVEALLAFLQSEQHTLAERNLAVHALGQIGDRRALAVLEKFYTGRECEHSKFLCQHEVRKAIDRCSGRNWAPRWLPFFPRQPQHQGRS